MSKGFYNPLTDPDYMSPRMRGYFSKLLKAQLEEAIKQETLLRDLLLEHKEKESDVVDVGMQVISTEETTIILKRTELQRSQLEKAIQRLRHGMYGYCSSTGEKIGVPRLLANLTATLCLEEQERQERTSKAQRMKL